MKIYIHYAKDEEAELDRIIEALRDTMPAFGIRRLKDRKNHKSVEKHGVYFVHNMRHREL